MYFHLTETLSPEIPSEYLFPGSERCNTSVSAVNFYITCELMKVHAVSKFIVIMSTPLGGGYIIFAFFAVRCPMSDVRRPASDVRRHAWFPLI